MTNSNARPQRAHFTRNRVLVRVLAALLVMAAIVAYFAFRRQKQPAFTHVALDTANPFVVKLQNGEATIAMLVDALGSTSQTTRRQAARAIVALRQHYIEETAQVVQDGTVCPLAFISPFNFEFVTLRRVAKTSQGLRIS